ncbi:MAG: BrnT family toxin [Candidatus Methylomirabilales bacterium]
MSSKEIMFKMVKRSNKMGQKRREGTWQLRVFHRKRVGKRDPRYLIKCGCCSEKVEIHYGGGTLEINGVMGSAEDWGEILLPLLRARKPRRRTGSLANLKNHRVGFEEATTVFSDPFSITIPDPDHPTEQRYADIGNSDKGRVLVVVYTERGETIRIISCRKATPAERRRYEEGIQ